MPTGPVIFSNEDARNQLVTEGEVITFRTSNRTTGETHVRFSRTGSKEFDCHIMRLDDLAEPQLSIELERYHEEAGFESAEAWKDAIREMHGEVPKEGYLYKVVTDERPVTMTDGGQPHGTSERTGNGDTTECHHCGEEIDFREVESFYKTWNDQHFWHADCVPDHNAIRQIGVDGDSR